MSTVAAGTKQRTFLGHPLGLYVLFFTEMWERFSYYGMRALLIVYMLNYFRWSQQEASYIFKIYTSLVYVTPILGGYLADRYLGNRRAVIIGALLMAIGHFLMAFDEFPIFMSALVFLIFGNGFFKPNMSTQVGRLYPANDGRRDGAYTIFYMGINLGAFLSPLICGWLAENTVGGYHSGFTMAGIGMIAGLVIYLLGQPLIKEIPADAAPAAPVSAHPRPEDVEAELKVADTPHPPLSEAQAEQEPSVLGKFVGTVPWILYALAGALFVWALVIGIWSFFDKEKNIFDAVAFAIGGGCLSLIGYLISVVRGALCDRILAILILAIFLVFFWGAFEQAGNVHNVWADQFTNRYLTEDLQAPPTFTKVGEDDGEPEKLGYLARFTSLFPNMVTLKKRTGDDSNLGWWDTIKKSFNPIPTAWYLSINALLIVLLAPLFAWLWIALDRRGMQPSTPMKMVFGVALMSVSMAIMMEAARHENERSDVAWQGSLPHGVIATTDHKLAQMADGKEEVFNGGRLTLDKDANKLVNFGVLDKNVCDLLIESTAPDDYEKKIKELKTASQKIDGDSVKSAEIQLEKLPPGFDWKYAGLKKSVVRFDRENKKLTAYRPLDKKEMKGMAMAAGDPKFRDTILELYVDSSKFRVSMWWLFWSYMLATLGEICLSPVGLSMVSKLAPARFATMLMGFWLIISFFGNFAAGAMGEQWGTMPPIVFFLLTTVVVGAAALVLLALVRWVTALMHGVK